MTLPAKGLRAGGRMLAVCAVLGSTAIVAQAACPALVKADAALGGVGQTDLASLEALRDVAPDQGCSGDDLAQLNRWVALGMFYKAAAEASSLAETEPLMREAVEVAGIWQVQNLLGDVAREQRDFDEAALRYQLAMQDMSLLADPASTYYDYPPSQDVFSAVSKKADESRLLAVGFVTLPGRPACQMQTTGFWTAQVVVPIRFVTNEDTMTSEGEAAADELYACLSALDPTKVRKITVIGHTDERGAAQFNQALSERRARAVMAYLKKRGVTLEMAAVGRGESELFEPDSAFDYSKEERWQMSRRVEVDVVQDGD